MKEKGNWSRISIMSRLLLLFRINQNCPIINSILMMNVQVPKDRELFRLNTQFTLEIGVVPSAERIIDTIPAARKYNPITNIKYFFKSSFMINSLSVKNVRRYFFPMKIGIIAGGQFQIKQILSIFEHPIVVAFLGILQRLKERETR